MIRILRYDTPEQMAGAAAALISSEILRKPDCVLGLATGSSPVGTYARLAEMHQIGILDFSRVTSFNLDEYVGIPKDHPCSYHFFMQEHLFGLVNIRPENAHVPNGDPARVQASAEAYDRAIAEAGGLDLQLLGIGRNGHIGFNEPGDRFIWRCHAVDLSESTIQANKRFFDSADQVPRQAISLGIGGILGARRIVLLASGPEKAGAIAAMLRGDITPRVQASILRVHGDVTLILDRAAASGLDQ